MRLTLLPGTTRSRRGLGLVASATTVVLGAATLAVVAGGQAGAATGCRVDYTASNWGGADGFTAGLHITNLGDPWNGWTLTFTFPGNQRITPPGWSANWTQPTASPNVTATPLDWNRNLTTNQATDIGFNGTFTGTNNPPTNFAINGVACTGTPPPTTTTTTSTSTTTTTTPPPGSRVDNPYSGARVYVNPQWAARANAEPGGSRIANQPTGVWLDRIAAINGVNGSMGLRAHLTEAVRQSGGQPLVIQIVIYDLPGRDCAALASNGELGPTEIDRYRTQYIDPIATIMADTAFRTLRIVTIVEIDSLPNLVTNTGSRPTATALCNTMLQNGNYVNGIGYALARLGAIPNVYNYLDAAHHGWIGWDDNFGATADLMAQAARAAGSTTANVHGFITATANYSALREPYFTINDTVNGVSVRQSTWVDWNRYVDELTFAQAFRQRLVQAGFSSSIGMLIDTSRNGWGGTARPTGPGPLTDVNTYVNGGRVDRRIHLGNWCNQSGAGLGERPRSAPATGIDAYVWIKPPGESDGSSTEIPNDEGKGFDRMCDPTYTGNARNGFHLTGALPNAPLSGHWFSAQFQELMRNAFPPLQ